MGSGQVGDKDSSTARRASSSSGGKEGPPNLEEFAGGDSLQAATNSTAPTSSGLPTSTQLLRSGSSKAKPGRNAETERATTVEKAAKEAAAAEDGDSCDPSTARRSALVPSSKKSAKKPEDGGQWQWMAHLAKLPELSS